MRTRITITTIIMCLCMTLDNNIIVSAKENNLNDDILNATLLMEELLNEQYTEAVKQVEQNIENNRWNYTLTMDTLYNNGNPYENLDYQKTIAMLCTVMNHSKKTIADIQFLEITESQSEIESPIPLKTDKYIEIENGLYEKQGVKYITLDGSYPTYSITDDGYYVVSGTEDIVLDKETVYYGNIILQIKDVEKLARDAGLDYESIENEYSERLDKIIASGIDESHLEQSIFVQVQSGEQLLDDKEREQLTIAEDTTSGNRKSLINVASSLIGHVPYQWGGKSSKSGYDTSWYTYENGQQKGLDCSGYIQWVFRTAGYSESTWTQLISTASIMQNCEQISQDELQIGDLGILNTGETINHVGMYIGNGYYIHCNAGDRTVSISKPEFTLFYRVANTDTETLQPQTDSNVASSITYTDEELYLAAQTVWHEARGEGSNGWIAVAEVIKNRFLNSAYPDTLQEVIYQPGQFSYNEEIVNMKPNDTEIAVVKMVLDGKLSILGDENIMWFKNPKIAQAENNTDSEDSVLLNTWNGHEPYKIIGNHVFYK